MVNKEIIPKLVHRNETCPLNIELQQCLQVLIKRQERFVCRIHFINFQSQVLRWARLFLIWNESLWSFAIFFCHRSSLLGNRIKRWLHWYRPREFSDEFAKGFKSLFLITKVLNKSLSRGKQRFRTKSLFQLALDIVLFVSVFATTQAERFRALQIYCFLWGPKVLTPTSTVPV